MNDIKPNCESGGWTGVALWVELREMFDCPLCLGQYQDPRILPECGHQCCKTCIENIWKSHDSVITCPTCGVDTRLEPNKSIGDLPKPLAFNKLHTTLNKMKKEAGFSTSNACGTKDTPGNSTSGPCGTKATPGYSTCGPCGIKDIPAHMYCHQCKDRLCTDCATIHSNIELFNGHQASDISAIAFCKNHVKETLSADAFCFTCNTLICLRCTLSDHDGHTIDHLHKVAGQVRASWNDCRIRATREIRNMEKYTTKMEKIQSDWEMGLEQTMSLINGVSGLIKALDFQVGHLSKSVTARYILNCQRLNETHAELTAKSEKHKEILKMAVDLTFATDVQQVVDHPSLIHSISWPQHPLVLEFQNILQRPEIQSIYNTMNRIRAKLCVTETHRLYYNLDSKFSVLKKI